MSENNIDALIYSGIRNNVSENNWNINSPDFRELTTILDKTTVKRACCLNKGKRGSENDKEYKIKVRLPLPPNVDALDMEKKYKYYDKEISIPISVCDMPEFADFKYDGENGNTKCDKFYKGYCENILADYKKLSGADKDPKKFDMNEFAKFKPECACYVPPLEGLPKEQKMFPHCWFAQCGTSPYRPSQLRTECKFNIQQCIQNVTNNIGSIDSSQLALEKANLVNNCSQDTNSGGDKTTESKDQTNIKTITPPATKQPSQIQPSTQLSLQPSSDASNNMPVFIGVGVFIVILIIIAVVFFMRKKKNEGE
jgi:hypothetical protein